MKIDDIYNYEVGKFMYLNDIKALPQIFENYFLPLIKLIITTLEVNLTKIIFLTL